jgi:adenosylmethionine-8-amino-7-oxononanoate aminotransferase
VAGVHRRDFADAKHLGRKFAEDLRLREDLGWSETIDHETVTLTMPPDELTRTLARLHKDAASALGVYGALMHGPTFMANPLACAVSLASLELLDERNWMTDVARIERGLRDGLASAWDVPGVREVRVLGAMGVIELDHDVNVSVASAAAIGAGVWLRPFRNLIYTMPPYVTGDDDVASIAAAAVAGATACVDRPVTA